MTYTAVKTSWKTELKQLIDSTYHLDLEVEGRWNGNTVCISLENGRELRFEGEQAQYVRNLIEDKHDQDFEEALNGLAPDELAEILSITNDHVSKFPECVTSCHLSCSPDE